MKEKINEIFFIEELAENYKKFDENFKGNYLESFIEEIGKNLTKDKKSIFLTKNTAIKIVGEILGITEDEIYKELKNVNSNLIDKYIIIGFYDGKKIYKSEISGAYKKIINNIIDNVNLTKVEEYLLILDVLSSHFNLEVI